MAKYLEADAIPPALRGTPPKWATDETPVPFAWGPFVVERRGREKDLGTMLEPSPDGPNWLDYDVEGLNRSRMVELVGPAVVKGNVVALRTRDGAIAVRPLRESDRSWIDVPADVPIVDGVRRGLGW